MSLRVQIRGREQPWSCWSRREFMFPTCLCCSRPTFPSTAQRLSRLKTNGKTQLSPASYELIITFQYYEDVAVFSAFPLLSSSVLFRALSAF